VNSLGFRGPEISSGRRTGTVRIVVLGDSFTYGEGVTAAEALPAQLEHLLNQRRSGRFEVFHLGVPGYNSAQEFAYLKEAGLALKPDLVVVAFTLSTHRHKYGNVFEPAHSVIPAILRRESIRHALDARLKIAGMTGWNGSFI